MERIKSAIDNNDSETGTREAHTIKGLAGNIGADVLYKLSGIVEGLLKNGQTDGLAQAMENMDNELKELLKRISEGMYSEGVTAKTSDIIILLDMESLSLELKELAKLLADDDSEAVGVMDNLIEKLNSAGFGEDVKKAQTNISKFDFEEALINIKDIAKAIGVSI
jgi:HPt (histidine-containing phosphotransfer) domain-containing protein